MKKPKGYSLMAEAGSYTITGSQPIARVHEPLPEHHPFYALVGRVASEWAHLEHALDLVIWELAGLDQRSGSCITGQMMGYRPRMNAIAGLAVLKRAPANTVDYINTVMGIIGNINSDRNRYIHDAWFSDDEGSAGQFVSYSERDREFGIKDVDEASALKLIAQIRERVAKIRKLQNRLRAELAP